MATEDVVLLRKISAVPESYRHLSPLWSVFAFLCLFLVFSCSVFFVPKTPAHSSSCPPPLLSSHLPILLFSRSISLLPHFPAFSNPQSSSSSSYSIPLLLSSTAVTDINRGNKSKRGCHSVYLCVCMCVWIFALMTCIDSMVGYPYIGSCNSPYLPLSPTYMAHTWPINSNIKTQRPLNSVRLVTLRHF